MSQSPVSPSPEKPSESAPHPVPPQLLHDLRTPLNQIIGYSEMLAEQAQDTGQTAFVADLHKVQSAGQQLLSLLDANFTARAEAAVGASTREAPPRKTLAETAVATEQLSSGASQGLLLVVDDNETNRDVLSRRLQRQGYETQNAENGQQALEMLRARDFDLVLLDIMMPEMDGYETLRQIKDDAALSHLPVIMISALGEMDSVVRCIELGAEDYLSKPFNPTLLKARVGACLHKKRAHDREARLFVQLQENYDRLQQLEKMRDDLTHMIVHDLRSPLSSLLTGLQLIPVLGPLSDTQKECLEIAVRGGNTLLDLINDLLDISKMESGTFELALAPLSIESLFNEAVAQIEAAARDSEITLSRVLAPDLPELSADENKLRRILVNLLGNALKFTPQRGEITLAARRGDGSDENHIVFMVSDNGAGIPPEAFARIFEKFGQVESRQTGIQMSTGLGLTFCKMAVEAHGGRIWVESTLDKGSTFFFTVPLQRAAPPEIALPAAA